MSARLEDVMEIQDSTRLIEGLRDFQEQMKGEAEKAGLLIEDAVDDWITNSRREETDSTGTKATANNAAFVSDDRIC